MIRIEFDSKAIDTLEYERYHQLAGRLEAAASNPHSSPTTRDNAVYPFKPYDFLVVSDPLELLSIREKDAYHVPAHFLRNSLSNESNPILKNR